VQHHFRHADGSWRLLESIGNLLGGESAQAVVVNSRDITDRRRLEDQLRQSQKMEAIGQLAAGVAHDFNNLLTIIQGNASLLLSAPGRSEEDAGSSSQIVQAAERAAGLTRQLLMFSRKQIMQLAHLDLNEVVGNMTKMLQRILGEDVTLRSEYAPSLPLIHADAGMLEQVLLNLAVNARDAMPEGGQLRIQTSALTLGPQDLGQHPEAVAGHHVCLRVSDTGCGITPEHLPRIFDPFFTTKEIGKGTGLGLATVYGIVKQHHGWIEASSEIGQGTIFQIYLPAAEGSAAARRAGATAQELPRGHEVVLVVEDERAVRLLVNNLLQRCGYTVLMAESGVAALAVWKEHKHRVELLLTDMVMPDGMSGRELARTLKRDKPDLKVIYTSGYSAATTGEVPPLTEGVNFLQKPYPPYHLAKTVRACLDRA
jgi:signal transduction histidine kinase